MKPWSIVLLMGLALAGGCRQGALAPRNAPADDVVGKYAQERKMSREQAELCIRDEMAAARKRAVSSSTGSPASSVVR